MVQITKALQLGEDGAKTIVPASLYDKARDGQKACLCPDPACSARLSHVRAHRHTYHDVQHGGVYQLDIPAYFRRHPQSPPHDDMCGYLKQQLAAQAMRVHQEAQLITTGRGAGVEGYVYNLNILGTKTPPQRRPASLRVQSAAKEFDVRAEQMVATPAQRPKPVTSLGCVAGLLDDTAFDTDARAFHYFQRGGVLRSLAEMYKENPVDLFREKHGHAKSAARAMEQGFSPARNMPVLFLFKPIAIPNNGKDVFWDARQKIILGQTLRQRGRDHCEYKVGIALKLPDEKSFQEMTAQIRAGQRSFLVLSDDAAVDISEFAQRMAQIRAGGRKKDIYTQARVTMPGYIFAWTPRTAQQDMSEKIDMPPALKPPKDMNFTPIGY